MWGDFDLSRLAIRSADVVRAIAHNGDRCGVRNGDNIFETGAP